jgi:hypothetical protein
MCRSSGWTTGIQLDFGARAASAEIISRHEIRRIFRQREIALKQAALVLVKRCIRAWRTCSTALLRNGYVLSRLTIDRRVPWMARIVAAGSAGYLFSPIDLIADEIPIVGYLDDVTVVGVGLAIVKRIIPTAIWAEHRAEAAHRFPGMAGRYVKRTWPSIEDGLSGFIRILNIETDLVLYPQHPGYDDRKFTALVEAAAALLSEDRADRARFHGKDGRRDS